MPNAPDEPSASNNYAACHNDVEAPIDAKNTGVFYLNSATRYEDITDGTSFTIFVGEKLRSSRPTSAGCRAPARRSATRGPCRTRTGPPRGVDPARRRADDGDDADARRARRARPAASSSAGSPAGTPGGVELRSSATARSGSSRTRSTPPSSGTSATAPTASMISADAVLTTDGSCGPTAVARPFSGDGHRRASPLATVRSTAMPPLEPPAGLHADRTARGDLRSSP